MKIIMEEVSIMFYLILLAVLVIWFVIIKIKGNLSWHSFIITMSVSLMITDTVDIVLCQYLNLYHLHLKIFDNKAADMKHAIILSDVFIVPLMGVIFCYYYAKHKKWWIPIIHASTMILIEGIFHHFKYIEYNDFNPLHTAVFYIIGTVMLTCWTDSLINYSPPLSDRANAFHVISVIMALPILIFGTWPDYFFIFRPGFFANKVSDNWIITDLMYVLLGVLAWLIYPKLTTKLKRTTGIIFLGSVYLIFSLVMHAIGKLIYYRWNNFFHVLIFAGAIVLAILYDRWETNYRQRISATKT